MPAAVKKRRRNALMTPSEEHRATALKTRIGSEAVVLVDGPSAEHELVLQGRLEGQAPDIDAVVYLTDCDPDAYRPATSCVAHRRRARVRPRGGAIG